MPRSPRGDFPGAWLHVMNRGLARRTVFERREDVRFFLSRVARAVHSGLLEVHAYCILTTHFHLLAVSPQGDIAGAMRRIQNSYVRYFNRSRRRDGPLMRGRFRSRIVDSMAYRCLLVRYIDENAEKARLASQATNYVHGSAYWHAREKGPPWLARHWIEAHVRGCLGMQTYDPATYSTIFSPGLEPEEVYLQSTRTRDLHKSDPLDDLILAAPDEVLSWMRRKAELADNTEPGLPVAEPGSVMCLLEARQQHFGDWTVCLTRKHRDAWLILAAGLLRDLCGCRHVESALHLGRSGSNAAILYQHHRRLIREDAAYGCHAKELSCLALHASLSRLRSTRMEPDNSWPDEQLR